MSTFASPPRTANGTARKGPVVAANDAVVKGREELFESDDPSKPDEAAALIGHRFRHFWLCG